MKKIFIILLLLVSATFSFGGGKPKKPVIHKHVFIRPARAKTVHVKAYLKKNGTYVKPHSRSLPQKKN